MKLRNITLAFAAAILSLTGCVNEELAPSNAVVDGLPTTLNLTFTTEEVITKAASGYEFATSEEIQINTLAVAVFKVNTNNSIGGLLGFKYFSATNEGELTPITDTAHTPNRPGYKVSGIPAETGKVKILTIANSGVSEEDLKTASATYTEFKALAESYLNGTAPAYGFVANNLVKFRELETTLSTATKTTPIHIELVQLAARIDVGINIINAAAGGEWTFAMSSYEVSGINASSNIFLGDDISAVTNTKISSPLVKIPNTTKSLTINSTDHGVMDPEYVFSFYTYEKKTTGEGNTTINIDIIGKLQDQGQPEETKMFRIVLDPVKVDGDPMKQTNGVAHGNIYTVIGSIDVTLKTINFTYAIRPWEGIRNIDVIILPIDYLYVKDLFMNMVNVETTTTKYNSSSDVYYTDLKVYSVIRGKDVLIANPGVSIGFSANRDGNLSIYSPLPTNYVPRKITFTVWNKSGLWQDITIMQYPWLYVTSHKSADEPSGGDGQNNDAMYVMNVLVADFASLPYPDDRNWRPASHFGPKSKAYTDYIRQNAVLGYPSTNTNGTINSIANNARISPRFMLASQHGTNSANSYSERQKFCRDYKEKDSETGTTYSDWRMPTIAEVYIIDVLQNISGCEVKNILEGHWYWSADNSSAINFMDHRLNYQGYSPTAAAVRCVRDIKNNSEILE